MFCIIFAIILGFVMSGNLAVILIFAFFFAFSLTMFFVFNNSFVMSVGTPDIRGMLGGCLQAFRESGLAIGIAFVNFVHDIYFMYKWNDVIPVDPTCETHVF